MPQTLITQADDLTYLVKSTTDSSFTLLSANFTTGVVSSSVLPSGVTRILTERVQAFFSALGASNKAAFETSFPQLVQGLLGVAVLDTGAEPTISVSYGAPTATFTVADIPNPAHILIAVPHSMTPTYAVGGIGGTGGGGVDWPLLAESDGTNSAPAFAFANGTSSGMYLVGAGQLGLAGGGTLGITLAAASITTALPTLGPAGLVSAPSFAFTGSATTGMYRPFAGELGLAAAGVLRLYLSGNQVDPGSDNVQDFGQSARRWRALYAYSLNLAGKITQTAGDSSASPGNATVNTAVGKSAIAASASSVTITNSNVTTSSLIRAWIQQGSSDLTLTNIDRTHVPGAGSFEIHGNDVATAAVTVGWEVIN